MPKVEVAKHLHRFFPVLKDREIEVEGSTAKEIVFAMDAIAPGFSDYIVTERGSLRQHVNVFIEDEMIVDRVRLSDRVPPGATVYIMQALSGG
jgi:sulfur-carrier protein